MPYTPSEPSCSMQEHKPVTTLSKQIYQNEGELFVVDAELSFRPPDDDSEHCNSTEDSKVAALCTTFDRTDQNFSHHRLSSNLYHAINLRAVPLCLWMSTTTEYDSEHSELRSSPCLVIIWRCLHSHPHPNMGRSQAATRAAARRI